MTRAIHHHQVAPSPDAAVVACRMRAALGPAGRVVVSRSGAWSLCLSRGVVAGHWLFTAKLVDGSRSSEADWSHLGALCEAVGAPDEAMMAAHVGATAPAGMQTFTWRDTG